MNECNSSSMFFGGAPSNLVDDFADIEEFQSSVGGYCIVYKYHRFGKIHALKALKPEFVGNPVYESLLRKEFDIGYEIDHPNIAKTISFENVPKIGHAILSEWVDGDTLAHVLAQGRLSDEMVRKIICEMCDALDYIHHKQVVHRDLKPSNIIITHNGNNVKVIDFGLSDTDYHLIHKASAGTKWYASPEQIAGGAIDCRSDIYALGKIIAELSGKYYSIAMKCTDANRDLRYSSASEVKQAVMMPRRYNWTLLVIMILLFAIAVAVSFVQNSSNNGVSIDTVNERVDASRHEILSAAANVPVGWREYNGAMERAMKDIYSDASKYRNVSRRRAAKMLEADSVKFMSAVSLFFTSDTDEEIAQETFAAFRQAVNRQIKDK